MRVRGVETDFVVTDVANTQLDAMRKLGFKESASAFIRTCRSDAPNVLSTYDNFCRYTEEMVLQASGARPWSWKRVLLTFVERVAGSNVRWGVIGSAALAVRGIDVQPGDIDVMTDEQGAYALGELFADTLVSPVTEWVGAGWFGRAFPGGRLEWLGNAGRDAGAWSLADLQDSVHWEGHTIVVPALEVLLGIEQRRGRTGHVEAIRRFLSG
jgi:hypothetical protein